MNHLHLCVMYIALLGSIAILLTGLVICLATLRQECISRPNAAANTCGTKAKQTHLGG